jgi:hypothetical protein
MDLVIARCKEKIDWIYQTTNPVYLYDKNTKEILDVPPHWCYERLPNVGRESHTYLHHIITNYYSLSPVTAFLQGNPFDHCPYVSQMMNLDINDIGQMIRRNHSSCWVEEHFIGLGQAYYPESESIAWKELRTTLQMCIDYLGIDPSHKWQFVAGANFIVSKLAIIRWPLRFYVQLYDWHEKYEVLPWALEILWGLIFGTHPEMDVLGNFYKIHPECWTKPATKKLFL